MMTRKKHYVPPQIEVIQVENEGVLAASGQMDVPSFNDGGSMHGSRSTVRNSHNTSPASDIEDMINNILTIEQ